MSNDSRWFDVDRSASIRYVQTKIYVIQERNKRFVEGAEMIKDVPAHEHAMEFDEADRPSDELRPNPCDRLVTKVVMLVKATTTTFLNNL